MTTQKLSKREIQILRLISREYRTSEIARLLFISQHTVLSHRRNLMEKLQVRNTAGLIRKGFELGLLRYK